MKLITGESGIKFVTMTINEYNLLQGKWFIFVIISLIVGLVLGLLFGEAFL